jgi:hypothetical protein
MEVYRKQVEAFRHKFGRDMGPEDPFFFDPNARTPEFRSIEETRYALDLLVEFMVEAGIDPAAIYVFKSTGGLFPDAAAPFSPAQQSEWNAAVKEYEDKLRRHPRQ